VIGLYGGAFDPPHAAHVALVQSAKSALGLGGVLILVSADPGHKQVETPAATRLELARAAFPDEEVVVDEHPRTIDLLRDHPEWTDPIFLLGADEFSSFEDWKEPDEVLRLARVGVATRPGYPRERLQEVLERLGTPERVVFFDLEPMPIASSDIRARLARGEDVGDVIPAPVLGIIEREGLYGRGPRYTDPA
jgi:nicotinate-nucleotide adenylyltransferase